MHQPIEKDGSWQIDVPADNSCLFWACALAYLIPVLNDDALLEQRLKILFGEIAKERLLRVKSLLKTYNPFGSIDLFEDDDINSLVREEFRNRVIAHIGDNKDFFKHFWEQNVLEESFDDYLSRMHDPKAWGGNIEISAISRLLGCSIHLKGNQYTQDFTFQSNVSINIMHVNTHDKNSRSCNHYNFILPQAIGTYYKNIYERSQATNAASQALSNDKKTPLGIRISDLEKIYTIYVNSEKLLRNLKSDKADELELLNSIMEISKNCQELHWNNDDHDCVRNHYGSFDYKKNKENNHFVDFELLSNITTLITSLTLRNHINNIICANRSVFVNELQALQNNFYFILIAELQNIKKIPGSQSETSLSVMAVKIETCQKQLVKPAAFLEKIPDLSKLIHFFSDYSCLQVFINMTNPLMLNNAFKATINNITRRDRYIVARIITILGEASKSLSQEFIEVGSVIPLRLLAKIRNKFAHMLSLFINGHKGLNEIIVKVMSVKDGIQLIYNKAQFFFAEYQLAENSFNQDKTMGWAKIVQFKYFTASESDKEVYKLENEIAELKEKINTARQFEADKPQQPLTAIIAADETDKQRILNKIQMLEEKKKTKDGLSPPECMILEKAKKQLDKINRKISQPVAKQQPKKSKKESSAELEVKYNQALEKLRTTRVATVIEELINFDDTEVKSGENLEPSSKEKTSDDVRLLKKLEKELLYLEELYKNRDIASTRDFAVEYCLSIIGQLFRDLDKHKHSLESLMSETLIEGIKETKQARNKKIMHDFTTDHTSLLSEVSMNFTLPITSDVNALQFIVGSNIIQLEQRLFQSGFEEFLKTDLLSVLAELSNNLGFSYTRLGKHQLAEQFYLAARRYFSGRFFFECLGFKVDASRQYEILDQHTAYPRYVVLDNLSKSMLAQEKYADALPVLKDLKQLVDDYNLVAHPKYHIDWLVHLGQSIAHVEGIEKGIKYFQDLLKDFKEDNENALHIKLNLAELYYREKRYHEGYELLKTIPIKDLKTSYIKVIYYITYAKFHYNLADQCDVKLSNNLLNAINIAKDGFTFAKLALALVENNRGLLVAERGNGYISLKKQAEDAVKRLATMICNLKSRQQFDANDFDNQLKLQWEILEIQKTYLLDWTLTLFKISQIYAHKETVFKNNTNQIMAIEKLKEVLTQLKNVSSENFKLLAQIYASLGFGYEHLKDYHSAQGYLDEARKIIDANRLVLEEEDDIRNAILNCKRNIKHQKVLPRQLDSNERPSSPRRAKLWGFTHEIFKHNKKTSQFWLAYQSKQDADNITALLKKNSFMAETRATIGSSSAQRDEQKEFVVLVDDFTP